MFAAAVVAILSAYHLIMSNYCMFPVT